MYADTVYMCANASVSNHVDMYMILVYANRQAACVSVCVCGDGGRGGMGGRAFVYGWLAVCAYMGMFMCTVFVWEVKGGTARTVLPQAEG